MCEALVFESRYVRNGRGKPDTVALPLKAQSGETGKGDGAPLVIVEGAHGVTLTAEAVALQGVGGKPGQGYSAVLISSAAASRAKTCPLLESGLALLVPEADSSLSLQESWVRYVQSGYSLKMFPASSVATEGRISTSFSERWMNSGMHWRGESSTADSSECPSGAVECTLSDILESSVPQRYYLSPRACTGILRRAERRGKALPPHLEQALRATADTGATSITKLT